VTFHADILPQTCFILCCTRVNIVFVIPTLSVGP
jgi:hypothetical protein